jgi:hypothetical protein
MGCTLLLPDSHLLQSASVKDVVQASDVHNIISINTCRHCRAVLVLLQLRCGAGRWR